MKVLKCSDVTAADLLKVNTSPWFWEDCVDDLELDRPDLLERPIWGEVPDNPEVEQWVRIIELVTLSGAPNKDCCKIRVNDHWNFDMLDRELSGYKDKEIVELLKYGWPVERSEDIPLEMGGINHEGATKFEEDMDQYIQQEVQAGCTISPFEKIPFKSAVGISPISTRAMKDSDSRRVILDCSWPMGCSVNDGIDKDWCQGVSTDLKYPTIDMVACKVFEMATRHDAETVLLYKEDMLKAFRQISACPLSVPLLGYRWRSRYYFDLVMVMGCRIAPYICQRTTSMIVYIHRKEGYFSVNYVDDFLGIEYLSKVWAAHYRLIKILEDLGVERSEKKSTPPSTVVEFIGNLVDSVQLTLGVTLQRKVEVL